jgi:hypothetical protein
MGKKLLIKEGLKDYSSFKNNHPFSPFNERGIREMRFNK